MQISHSLAFDSAWYIHVWALLSSWFRSLRLVSAMQLDLTAGILSDSQLVNEAAHNLVS